MNTQRDDETVHIKADDILPLAASSTPEAQMLKRILEQMVENERQRVRNEFLRIILAILVVLLLLLGCGFWLSRDVLRELKAERQTAEQSWNEMIRRVPALAGDVAPAVEKRPVHPPPAREMPRARGQEIQGPPVRFEAQLKKTIDTAPEGLLTDARSSDDLVLTAGGAGPKQGQEPMPSYAGTLTIPVRGQIPLRAPIPGP